MPAPVFIICSEGGSVDRHTNQLSVFDIVERISFREFRPAPLNSNEGTNGTRQPDSANIEGRLAAFNALRMTAVWKQSAGDAGQEFEFRTTLSIPGAREPQTVGEGTFVFKTPLHRLIATIYSDMPAQSGDLVIRNEVRRLGEGEWVRQEYIIPVDRLDADANQRTLPLS